MDYQNEAEIRAVVHGFESCTTAKEDFTHGSHLTVAAWYLTHLTHDEALNKMRDGLFRFLDHHGVGRAKYHETLTIFWIKLVERAINASDEQASIVFVTNKVLESLSDSRVVYEYYSEESLISETARNGWVEPDLKGL